MRADRPNWAGMLPSVFVSAAVNLTILAVMVRVLAGPPVPVETRIAVTLEPAAAAETSRVQPPRIISAALPALPVQRPHKSAPVTPSSKTPTHAAVPSAEVPQVTEVLGIAEQTGAAPSTGPLGGGSGVGSAPGIGGTNVSGPGAASASGAGGGGGAGGPAKQDQPRETRNPPPVEKPPIREPRPEQPPTPRGETRRAQAAGQPRPAYPRDARDDGSEGVVTLIAEVATDGRISGTRLEKSSGDKRLDRAAENAVRQWTYKPALKDGVAVKSSVRVRVEFRLD
ncbi:MAG: TonB family protein [Armatimonadetes bacterium]|nr:TonB family protein [Armatimonadota bacterium]